MDHGYPTEPREPDGAHLDSNREGDITMGSGVLQHPILILHERHDGEMPALWPVTASTTSCQDLNTFVGLEHFSWGATCANNSLNQWHHEFTLVIHFPVSFPCTLNQREVTLLLLGPAVPALLLCHDEVALLQMPVPVGQCWVNFTKQFAIFCLSPVISAVATYIGCAVTWELYHGQLWLPLPWTHHTSTCPKYLHEEIEEYSDIGKCVLPVGRYCLLKKHFSTRLAYFDILRKGQQIFKLSERN